jgi:hypothetical protein
MNNINPNQAVNNSSTSTQYSENIRSENRKKGDPGHASATSQRPYTTTNDSPSAIVSLSSAEASSASPEKVAALKGKHAAYATHSLKINASAHKIWNILTDVKKWPDWVPGVSSASNEKPIRAGSDFEWRSNGFSIKSTVGDDIVGPYRITWDGETFGTKAHHEWMIISDTGGTSTVTTSESFDGWLPSLFPRTMQNTLDESLTSWLDALKKRAE